MPRNIWTRALWGGLLGTTAQDLILWIGQAGGWVKLSLLPSLASLVAPRGVAWSPSGTVLGFVIHLIAGTAWALLFTSFVRTLGSRHNMVAGLFNGLLLWLLWGIALPPAGITPAPWSVNTATTLFSLASTVAYGLVVGYCVSAEAIREEGR